MDYLALVLVLAQPLEGGVAQDRVGGPAGKFDLGDKRWSNPMNALARSVLGQNDRRGARTESIEPFAQIGEPRCAEARADASCIPQCSRRIIVAGEQGAKALAPAFGIGEADDDKFVAIAAFDLEPGSAPPRAVRRIAALRDDAFEAKAGRLAKNGRALAGLVVAVAQNPLGLRRNDLAQDRLAVFECGVGDLPAIAKEQIEGEEIQCTGLAAGNRVLQAGETRRSIGRQADELAVDQRRVDRQPNEALRQLREFGGPVEAV